jgi:lambda repressor-like predicted transcriptional regulator
MDGKITPLDIQNELKKRGITQKEIAQEQQVSEMSVSDVVNFRMVSRKLMAAIAEKIERDPKEVFHWYFGAKRPARAPRVA